MTNYNRHSTKTFKRLMTVILVFMSFGTLFELLLLGHHEDRWQLTPIGLISLSVLVLIALLFSDNSIAVNVFRVLMILCILSGGLGMWFHLNANMEFEKELHPSLSGWSLFRESLSGAMPSLAPGSMIALGLVGYLFTLTTFKQQ